MIRVLLAGAIALAACDDGGGGGWPRSPVPLEPELRLAIVASIDDADLGAGVAIDPVEPHRDERWFRGRLAEAGAALRLVELSPIDDGFDARVVLLGKEIHILYRTVGGRGFTCQTHGDDHGRAACLAFYRSGTDLVLPFALGDELVFAEYGRGHVTIRRAEERDDDRDVRMRVIERRGPAVLFEALDEPEHHRYHAYVRRPVAGLDVVCEQDGADLERIRLAFARCLTLHAAR